DPNSNFLCRGSLNDYAACQCREDDSELSCINAQFVDTDVFLHINNYHRHFRKITFHGNNFQDLPDNPLFGTDEHQNLEVLNISANYIVNLNSKALKGMPNLLILDMSNNEIVLKPEDTTFLSYIPKLKQLYLRRAFTSLVNRTVQFALMMEMFENANLSELNYIDLSYNFFTSVPYQLACPFPSLRYIDLRQNFLQTVNINLTCLAKIEIFDLSRQFITFLNNFRQLDESFMKGIGQMLPERSIILKNSFYCNCKSVSFIKWVRHSRTVYKNVLACSRASPSKYNGFRLQDLPLDALDCNDPVLAGQASLYFNTISVLSMLLLDIFLYMLF
ncbi:unnamed protein product, partial [Dracunculus medinensis]|uniref:LRRCT domain-containing protein n=1 Tax=Dracunculus medinensis TaxID=318479 RepID=A0A0N4UCB9_DRAME